MSEHTYIVLTPVSHDGTSYAPGETIALDARHAAPLLEVESIAPRAAEDGAGRAVVLQRAIAALDPAAPDDYTQGGIPQVSALAREAGFDVSAAERDAAWVEFQRRQAP